LAARLGPGAELADGSGVSLVAGADAAPLAEGPTVGVALRSACAAQAARRAAAPPSAPARRARRLNRGSEDIGSEDCILRVGACAC